MLLTPRHPADPAALPRLALAALALAVLWPGIELAEVRPSTLFDPQNTRVIGEFLATFLPPAHAPEFLVLVGRAALETLAMASAGTALALLIAIPLSLLVTHTLSVSRIGPARGAWIAFLVRYPARGLLMLLRGIPELVWALLLVRAVGLGATAGVLAIAVTYGGMLGKVYSEIFESGDTRPARALLEGGSGRLAAFLYGVLPGCREELISYTVYRWECAIRASVVMGFVGAGGLGQQMELSMRMLNGGEVLTMLVAFLLMVVLADAVSALARKAVA